MKESLVVSACIQWLHLNGCFIWRNNSGAFKDGTGRWVRFGLNGSADIIGLTPKTGCFLAVECKSEKGKLSEAQEAFGYKVEARGGIYVVAKSTDDLEARKAELLS